MMLISSILMLKIFLCLRKEAPHIQKKYLALSNSCLTIDEAFILFSAVLHAISLSSSSMVEEEQYIWHYLVSTLYMIFLGMKISTILAANKSNQCDGVMGKANDLKLWSCEKKLFSFNLVEKPLSRFKEHHNYFQIPYLLVVLILGRIIRGWHQGGVNWTHLPDIAKWLDRSGSSTMNCFCIISLLVVIVISPTAIYLMRSQKILACTFLVCHFLSGMLILLQKVLHQRIMSLACSTDSLPKIIYSTVLISLIVILLSPWFINIKSEKDPCSIKVKLQPSPDLWIELALSESIKDCLHLFSGAFTATWCLLQMLLQRPVNMTPVLLLLLQIFSTKLYFMVEKGSRHKLWVEVASMYFLGMAGHFGLGNSNSIATIDVAGAFTGLSNHSTIFAGTLMFMITYASPLLISFSMIMFLPLDHLKFSPNRTATELINGLKITLGSSCLVPLSLNSVTLIFFTLVLYSMRNHLFVWSVFSPKYLYVCAASMSVYIGISIIAASVAYIILVLIFRIKMTS